MGSAIRFTILGGDARLRAAAAGFSALGYPTQDFPSAHEELSTLREALRTTDVAVPPIPAVTADCVSGTALGIHTLLQLLPSYALVYGGRVPTGLERPVTDYSRLEYFQCANAIPTAEGAIQILMEQLPVTLNGATALVIGFGRCGKALTTRLSALGAHVTVSARKRADLDAIEQLGLRSDLTGQYLHGLQYDCIINTVPAPVFPERDVARTRADCFLLDLASLPGGIDFTACEQLGRACRHALSLPGKVAPKTSGLIVRDTILDHLNLH